MTVVAASALSLSKLVEIYNLLAAKPVKSFRDKPTALARVEKELSEQEHEIFAVDGHEGEYDVRPVAKPEPVAQPVAEATEVKKAKKAKAATGGKRGPAPDYADDMVITVIVAANPKRPGKKNWDRFQLYYTHKTVGEFIAAGGHRGDLKWDVERKFITVTK